MSVSKAMSVRVFEFVATSLILCQKHVMKMSIKAAKKEQHCCWLVGFYFRLNWNMHI